MARDPWAEIADEVSPAAEPRTGPQPIYTIPDPVGQRQEAREDRTLSLAEQREKRLAAQESLTPAQRAIDTNFANSFVQWAVEGGRADYEKGRAQLEEAIETLRSGSQVTGGIVGRLPDAVNEIINPSVIPTRESIEEVVQRNLRLVLGAQFTEREGERLIARAYNPRLPEEENAKRVARLLRQIDNAAAAKEAAVQYYQENGTLSGWDGRIPRAADFDNLDLSRDAPQGRVPEARVADRSSHWRGLRLR